MMNQTQENRITQRARDVAASTWQVQDLRKGDAVVESRGDDTVRPRSPGFQLIHLLAGVQTVFTHNHPVVGGCRDHYT